MNWIITALDKMISIVKGPTPVRTSVRRAARLEEFRRSIMKLRNINESAAEILSFTTELFRTQHVGILIWNEETGQYLNRCSIPGLRESWPVYDPFLVTITEYDQVLRLGDLIDIQDANDRMILSQFFEEMKAEFLLPLILNETVLAVLFIGPVEDLTLSPFLIEDFRGYAVLALSNSIIYTRVESLLVSMEDKVKERTTQLEEATNQMIQSEKMAMLGVMVAGVAHELNTPSGVILNAAKNLQETVESFVGRPPPEGNFAEIVQLFNHHIQSGNTALPTSAFQIRRQLQKSLEAIGIDGGKELASFFVDHNFFANIDDVTEEKLKERLKTATFTAKIIHMYKGLSATAKSEMIGELEDLAGIHRNAKNILASASNIARLVKALRIYSRSGSGDFVQANIEESLETTLEILSSIWKHNVEIDRNYNHIPLIACDPDQLNQVWSNLLMNAYHASRSSNQPKIRILTELIDSEVLVRIQDTGTGIPEEIREKIWDPFFTTKEQGEGTGLGLSIVRRIIENHDGVIYFETGKSGTEFFIRLPIKRRERKNKPSRQSEYGRYDWR